MTQLKIVVDKLSDWEGLYPSVDVMLAQNYLVEQASPVRCRVINLCRNYDYLSSGYYCSLLAEARGDQVIPSVKALRDLSGRQWQAVLALVPDLDSQLQTFAGEQDRWSMLVCFGRSAYPELTDVARRIFEQLPVPVIRLQFVKRGGWRLSSVESASLAQLNETEQSLFAEALDDYSRLIWRKPRARKTYKYDLAILVDPDEAMPPSNPLAIKRFIQAAARQGIWAETIGRKDFARLVEYDALFVRATTSVNHFTYRFARRAQAEGLVVMDDPDSILRCTNKVYLTQLLDTHKLPMPPTRILTRADCGREQALIEELGLPVVLKIPDGSFSVGVKKAQSLEELKVLLQEMFRRSALLLAQGYLYTEFDWRIGVLNGQPLYACRYYMAQNHWQIYNHGAGKGASGGFDAMATFEVPKPVLKAAVNACRLIGDGFYGVDLKQDGNKVYIIEVNDNPSVESAVEDHYLGVELYNAVMAEFRRRLEKR
ncbi:RimK family protein [Gilvimarinus xylanilyticus]|uniref:RimK family protein n=1 Tax=Gilvimarinus xylanilyticus TaxID=2944139 RepID=A0A9X2I0N7_9GAMM|nr:RimK family protein [Gilvimarinus xylanilyticus]MCP8899986.1 RimK family protein [Gilvimarinus xylanilyticus]